jgi:hypothetical protein
MNFRILGLAACLLPAVLFAQPFQWTTFTSTSSIVAMTPVGDRLWTATEGGLAGYDVTTGRFDIYTNTRGLLVNRTAAVGEDAAGFVWAGLSNGLITRINPQTGAVRQIDDLQQGGVFEITDILAVGEEVFVAGNNGIYRFSYFPAADNYRVRESIRVLGGFSSETRVTALAVAGGYLYAGTGIGLARASLASANLSQPSVWQNFAAPEGLPELAISKLQGYDDLLLIATANYVLHFDGTAFTTEASIGGVIGFSSRRHNGILWATNAVQVFVRDGQTGVWANYLPPLNGVTGVEVLEDGDRTDVVASLLDTPEGRGGLAFSTYPAATSWGVPRRAAGIGGNFITALWVDPSGRLWAGGASHTSGVYVRDAIDGTWTNYTASTGYSHPFFHRPMLSFINDDFGGIWASSQGGGIARFFGDTLFVYNTTDSASFYNADGVLKPRFAGIDGDPAYVESRLARDARGDLWVTNLEAANGVGLISIPREWIAEGNNSGPWTYHIPNPSNPPTGTGYVDQVIVDPLQRVWVGTGRNPVRSYVLDPRGSPSDTTRDTWLLYQPKDLQDAVTCFEDINPVVLDWDIDSQGYLWIGTVNGAYYTQGGIPQDLSQLRFICVVDLPVGRRVNAVHVDAQDNKWFGTDNGVAVLDKNFNWIHVFQTATSVSNQSDLIANEISAITSNPKTGEVWIGTADGLSRFTSPYVSSGGDFKELWPYPNPFRADGTQRMCIDPERLGERFDDLRIYTISGRLVRKLTWREMTAAERGGGCQGWDGRNDDQQLVAGGVYVLVASTTDGRSITGKVAVLGR